MKEKSKLLLKNTMLIKKSKTGTYQNPNYHLSLINYENCEELTLKYLC